MGEYIPAEQEIIEVLCRVRETDWKWSDYRANKALGEMRDGTVNYMHGVPFGTYGEYLWKRTNYLDIPPEYMLSPKAWRLLSLPEVLDNIFGQKGAEADKYRQSLFSAIDDYRFAAKAMLLDTYRRVGDRYKFGSPEYIAMENKCQAIRKAEPLGQEYMPENPEKLYGIFPFLGSRDSDDHKDFRGEIDCDSDAGLVKKILCTQELQRHLRNVSYELDNSPNGKTSNDEQSWRAGVKITDRRVKLPTELFEETVLPETIRALLKRDYSNKKVVFKTIASSYEFGWSIIEKKYNEYRDDPKKKLLPALRRYGNEDLINKSNCGKKLP